MRLLAPSLSPHSLPSTLGGKLTIKERSFQFSTGLISLKLVCGKGKGNNGKKGRGRKRNRRGGPGEKGEREEGMTGFMST